MALFRSLQVTTGVEDEEGASKDGVGGGQATATRLDMYLVCEAAVAALEQGVPNDNSGRDGGVSSQ